MLIIKSVHLINISETVTSAVKVTSAVAFSNFPTFCRGFQILLPRRSQTFAVGYQIFIMVCLKISLLV